jgi:phage shock protein A
MLNCDSPLTSWLLCRMMENKVAEAMSKKETLKARALTAETTKQLNESITSMVCTTTESLLCKQETAADMRLISILHVSSFLKLVSQT